VTLTPTDTTDYTTATATVQLTVNKATLAVTANNASRTYDTANPAFTDTITGFVNGDTRSAVSGSASLTTTATLTSAVGAYPITAAQGTLSATNYAFSFVNGTLTITQATPTISWSAPSAITYGTALSATQLDASSAVAGSFAYTPASGTVLTAGTHTLSVTLTPTDTTDYTTTTATVQLTVNQVTTPAISWATPSAITYGTALSATQLDASSTVAGTFVYTPASGSVLTAGTHTLSVTFTPSDTTDYTTATTTVQLTVNQAMPTISWSAPSAITYGTALSATQLDASSTVAGTLAYTPASGTVLTAGAHTLSVTLTPTDTTDYTTATTTVQLTVNQATPTISWSTPSAITYGTALSATQLDASSTVAGTLAYTPASGTALTAGSHTLSVTLTPTDTTDYTTATTTVQLTVNQATPAVAIASSANPVLVQNSLTLTATVTSGAGTPTGTVTFLDGSTPLGTGTLADGVATLTTSSLTVGTHSISAAYGGDQNFVTAASSPLTQVVQDFSINVNPSAPAVVTALPGGTVVYTFTATPPTGSTFPANIVLTASGLPAGATYSFSPATIAAGAGSTTVTLTIDLPQTNAAARQVAADPGIQLATNSGGKRSGTSGNVVRRLAPFALALILLPFAGRLRRAGSRLRRTMSLLLFMLAGIGAIAGLGGCGSGTGFFAQPPETYTVTVTATSGALSHSFTFTLTVE
jgi:hypothetical protein